MSVILRHYVKMMLEFLNTNISMKRPSSSTRAAKTLSANPATDILLSNLPEDQKWRVFHEAPIGSHASDIVLINEKEEKVNIEVKDYGSNTKFKVEISITSDSELNKLFKIKKESFTVSKDDVLKRLIDKDESFISQIKKALESKQKTIIGQSYIKTKKDPLYRYIVVIPGDQGDWGRVRHSSRVDSSPRHFYTVSSVDIRNTQQVDYKDLADSIRQSFKEDQYLLLFDGVSSIRCFKLSDADPLGLGFPLFEGDCIEDYKITTHGGGIRPAVKITVKKDKGTVLRYSKTNV